MAALGEIGAIGAQEMETDDEGDYLTDGGPLLAEDNPVLSQSQDEEAVMSSEDEDPAPEEEEEELEEERGVFIINVDEYSRVKGASESENPQLVQNTELQAAAAATATAPGDANEQPVSGKKNKKAKGMCASLQLKYLTVSRTIYAWWYNQRVLRVRGRRTRLQHASPLSAD